ncbi:zinc ribbon domain-containing protein [Methanobrevibacter sp.]|uniref:zinc ribbon domain-containing protein n=1 Tax=Methanobrevibacter sp. TaxID=66852 RepID=UPI0025CF8354|nr:zinc ribbon domain-containing protein [Methanobrevibacter sp.]MBQ2961554.1 zinc ribbon domain-containing protein [Methanobrevibacter sp.]
MTKFCPECGFEQHSDDNRFCSNCGFDFSKLEDIESDNSIVNVPINSKGDSVSKPLSSDASKKSISGASSTSSAKSSSSSSTRTAKTYTSNSSENGFLSNLSFNKCFLAFALLLIFLLILGMISDATQTEPYSDNGLTSFMERSNSYGLSDFIDDSDNYYDDSDSEYLKYGGDGESDIFR